MKSVLILEDLPKTLNRLNSIFKNDDWQVFPFSNAATAFKFIQTSIRNEEQIPDIFIVDLFMPPFRSIKYISMMVLEQFVFMLPFYKLATKLTKGKEWGGLDFIKKVEEYITKTTNDQSINFF